MKQLYIIIFLLALTNQVLATSNAPFSPEEERISDFLSNYQGRFEQCQLPSNRTINNVIFFFEGFNGYTPKNNELMINLQHMTSGCSNNEFNFPNEDGPIRLNDFNLLLYKISYNSDSNLYEVPHTSEIVHGTPGIRHTINNVLCADNSKLNFSNTYIVYYASHENIQYVEDCYSYLRSAHPALKIAISGYSNGGHNAIQFVHNLLKKKMKPNLVLTIDPVPFNLVDTSFNYYAPSGLSWFNIYQKSDNRFFEVMGKAWGLQGKFVHGSAVNKKIDIKHSPSAHWEFLLQKESERFIRSSLNLMAQ